MEERCWRRHVDHHPTGSITLVGSSESHSSEASMSQRTFSVTTPSFAKGTQRRKHIQPLSPVKTPVNSMRKAHCLDALLILGLMVGYSGIVMLTQD